MKKLEKEIVTLFDENKRRVFLKSSVAAASAFILGSVWPASANDNKEQKSDAVQFLFVQNAIHITIEKNRCA